MLSFPAEREFIEQLVGIKNANPDSFNELELIKLLQRADVIGRDFEESITDFIFKLPVYNQAQTVDFILNKLIGEDRWNFDLIPWWVCELTSYRRSMNEAIKDLVMRYTSLPEEEFNFCYQELAKLKAADVGENAMNQWREVVMIVKGIRDYRRKDITLLSKTEVDLLCQPLQRNIFSLVAREIAYQQHKDASREISIFYNSLLAGSYSWTERPYLGWVDEIQDFCSEVRLDFVPYKEDDEAEKVALELGWTFVKSERLNNFLLIIRQIEECRRNEINSLLNPKAQNDLEVEIPTQPVILPWQGSKTELAELGYALLEAGLISGPREGALKTLADFFGQDLGNPAKHLQTLQKRKWDPSDKEPVTPLLDKLKVALKSVLKIKAIAPIKK